MPEAVDVRKPFDDDLAPPDFYDPVIEAYKKDVDRTLLRENLKLTVEQRILKAQAFHASLEKWRGAARRGANVAQDNGFR